MWQHLQTPGWAFNLFFPILSFEVKLTSSDLAKTSPTSACPCRGGGGGRAPAPNNHREERLGCRSGAPQRLLGVKTEKWLEAAELLSQLLSQNFWSWPFSPTTLKAVTEESPVHCVLGSMKFRIKTLYSSILHPVKEKRKMCRNGADLKSESGEVCKIGL